MKSKKLLSLLLTLVVLFGVLFTGQTVYAETEEEAPVEVEVTAEAGTVPETATEPAAEEEPKTEEKETASYALSVKVSPKEAGKISVSPKQKSYEKGTVVSLSVKPAAGWSFDGWTIKGPDGTKTSEKKTVKITMNGDYTVTANLHKEEKQAEKTTEKAAEKKTVTRVKTPIEKMITATAAKSAEKKQAAAAQKPAEKETEAVTEKPAEKQAAADAEKPAEKKTQAAVEKPAVKLAEAAAEKTGEEKKEEPAEKRTEEDAAEKKEESAQESGEKQTEPAEEKAAEQAQAGEEKTAEQPAAEQEQADGEKTAEQTEASAEKSGEQAENAEESQEEAAKSEEGALTVTFDVQGHGKAPAAQSIEEGGKANKPSNPSADDYKFGGWYTDAACTEAFDFNQTIEADITLYAKWKKKTPDTPIPFIPAKQSLITFNLDGGMLNGEYDTYMMIVLDDTVITLPRPYKPGYTFAYWEGSRYPAGASYKVKGDHTFTAKWWKDSCCPYTYPYPYTYPCPDIYTYPYVYPCPTDSCYPYVYPCPTESPCPYVCPVIEPHSYAYPCPQAKPCIRPFRPCDYPVKPHHTSHHTSRSASPKTGDGAQPALWLAVLAVGLIGLTLSRLAGKKRTGR